jgi:hypothetical protein
MKAPGFTTYLLIGIAFNTYLSQSLTLVQKTINPWSLEEVLVSPTGLFTFIVGSSMWGFIWSTEVIAIYLAVGVFAFGVVLSVNTMNPIVEIPLITVLTHFICLGIIFVLKRVPVLKKIIG